MKQFKKAIFALALAGVMGITTGCFLFPSEEESSPADSTPPESSSQVDPPVSSPDEDPPVSSPDEDPPVSSPDEDPPVVEKPVVDSADPLAAAEKKLVIGGYEWGPAADGLMFKVDGKVSAEDLSADKFTANTVVSSWGGSNTVELVVVDAYPSTEHGIETAEASEYFVVKFQAKAGQLSPFTYAGSKNLWTEGTMTINLSLAEGKTISVEGADKITKYSSFSHADPINIADRVTPSTALLKKGTHTKDEKTLTYAAYETDAMKNDGQKNPLVIWLHGAGEGGTDVDIALLGNDVTNLMEPEIQSYFTTDTVKGAYVFAAQTPTMWMDNGNGQNHSGGDISIYTAALKDMIDTYVAANGDIDMDRIYVGGCSNGGYMTMNMMIQYGDYFAAAYPVCEAYTDSYITADQIADLATRNIWFTHSKNDTTVNPNNYTSATYLKLLEAGAKNVYYSYFVDIRGKDDPTASQAWGSTGNYMGHFSWIYVFNNQCNKVQNTNITKIADLVASNEGGGANTVGEYDGLWSWMAAQKKGVSLNTEVAPNTPPAQPEPPAGGDGETIRLEGEKDAVVEGTPSSGETFIESNDVPSAGGNLGYLGVAGNKITFTFDADAAGKAELVLYMSSNVVDESFSVIDCTVTPSIFTVTINGTAINFAEQTITGGGSWGWNKVYDPINLGEVDVKAGANTVVVTVVEGGTSMPNIDCLDIIFGGGSSSGGNEGGGNQGGGTVTPPTGDGNTPAAGAGTIRVEAEAAEIVGESSNTSFVEEAAAASGGQSIGSIGVVGNTVTFTFTADAAGKAEIIFYMSSNNNYFNFTDTFEMYPIDQEVTNDLFTVTVNGTAVTFETQVVRGSYTNMMWNMYFDPVTMGEVDIVAGTNTVVITVTNTAVPNIDCMDVVVK